MRSRVQWSHCSVVDMDFFDFTIVVNADYRNMMFVGVLMIKKL